MNGLKQSSKCAVGGIVAALSLVVLISVAIIPFLTYALPAFAGMLIAFVVAEIDRKWAFGVYASVSILGVLLIPDKEVAAMYLVFFGYYPILKEILEKRLPKAASWVLKLLVFVVSMLASYWFLMKVMGLEIDEMEKFGIIAVPMLLGMGAVAFVIYDIALTRMTLLYNLKWKKYFRKYFK